LFKRKEDKELPCDCKVKAAGILRDKIEIAKKKRNFRPEERKLSDNVGAVNRNYPKKGGKI